MDYIILFTNKDSKEVFQIADALRENGFSVEMKLMNDDTKTVKKHMSSANNKNLIVYENSKLKVTELAKGSTYNIRLDELKSWISNSLNKLKLTSIH